MLGPNLLFFAIQPRVIMQRIFVLASHCCKYQFSYMNYTELLSRRQFQMVSEYNLQISFYFCLIALILFHLRINKASQFKTKMEVLEKAFSFN